MGVYPLCVCCGTVGDSDLTTPGFTSCNISCLPSEDGERGADSPEAAEAVGQQQAEGVLMPAAVEGSDNGDESTAEGVGGTEVAAAGDGTQPPPPPLQQQPRGARTPPKPTTNKRPGKGA